MTPDPDPNNNPEKDPDKPESVTPPPMPENPEKSNLQGSENTQPGPAGTLNPAVPVATKAAQPMTESEAKEAIEMNKTVASSFENLLRNPRSIVVSFVSRVEAKRIACFLAATAICLLGFGLVLGTMSGGHQLWAAPLKVAGGALLSGIICLPSLYIFSCLAGLNLKLRSTIAVLSAGLCLVSLLLVGFAPIAWLFAQSTDSTVFYGFLCLAFWGIALFFGYTVIRQAGQVLAVKRKSHLIAWACMFALVTIQMSTALRPIVGTADTILPEEKKFFLEHWVDEVKEATGTRLAREKVLGKSSRELYPD